MWIKIGVCMSLLAAVILFELLIITREEPAVEASASEDSANIEEEDVLGRLRFVDAGGVTSVFKVSQRWNVPTAAAQMEKLEDDTLLKLYAEPNAAVMACAAGEVTAISRDDVYGLYVRISHGSELESFYYNLSEVTVEEGQPVLAQDTLGTVAADGALFVRIRLCGAPVDAEDFIETNTIH